MFVLYQVANEKTAIKSFDKCAYLRILGSFPTRELAQRHVRKIGDTYEIRIAPTDTWRLLLNRPYDNDIHTYEGLKHSKLMELHTFTLEQKQKAVQQQFESKALGQIQTTAMFGKSTDLPDEDCTGINSSNINSNGPVGHSQTVSTTQYVPKVPGQNFAVVAIMPDYENKILYEQKLNKYVPEAEEAYSLVKKSLRNECLRNGGTLQEADKIILPNKAEFMMQYSKQCDTSEIPGDEPMVQFLGCFNTEEEAKDFLEKIKQVGLLPDISKACVTMYEFFKVRHIESANVQRYYQDPTTQQLMDAFFKARKLADTVSPDTQK